MVIEAEVKECKYCTEDVACNVKVVTEEGSSFGGGAVSA